MTRICRVLFIFGFAVLSRATDAYPVAGVVINNATNAPLPRARVNFYRSTATKPIANSITGDDGRFQFQLPAGSYVMLAGIRDTMENYGNAHPSRTMASAVVVGPGKDTGNLVFRFFPPSGISGRITDDAGEPVQDALVQLIRSSVSAGRRTTSVFGYQNTNDLGEYRFGHLPGDTAWYLAVTAKPWYNQPVSTLPGSHPAAAFASLYYPGTADASQATPLTVREGQEARADFTLSAVTNATLTVRYDASPAIRGTISLTCDGVAGTIAIQQNAQLVVPFTKPRRPDGSPVDSAETTFRGVPPGHYTVRVSGAVGNSALGATLPVDINGADQTVELSLKPWPKVSGAVYFPTGVSPTGTVTASLRNLKTGVLTGATVQKDGRFTFAPLSAGRYHFSLGGADGFYAAQIAGPAEFVRGGIVEIPEQGDVNLSITAGHEIGRLRGFAVDDGDRPIEGVFVILMAAPGKAAVSDDEVRTSTYQTESDGSFDFRSVPAGHYYLFAVKDPELEYSEPAIAAPYVAVAKQIDIPAEVTVEERVTLTPPR